MKVLQLIFSELENNKLKLFLEGGSKLTFNFDSFIAKANRGNEHISEAFSKEQFKLTSTYIKANKQITLENKNKKISFFQDKLPSFSK